MTTERFVCWCLGIDGSVIDSICEEFNIDLTDEEIMDAVKTGADHKWGVGMEILRNIFEKIVGMYPELDEDKFDYDVSSPSYPDFFYDDLRFCTKNKLDKIAGRNED